MHHADYVPLHLHSEYSLLDGAIKIGEMVETAVKMKMPAVAVTDHGNLFGAIDFYRKAVKAGLKPIIGCEVYVAPGSRTERARDANGEAAFHLILLAKDNDGYRNLSNLVTRAYTEGFYYKPRIDMDLLEQYSGGLIGLSACLKGEVPYNLRNGREEVAREIALRYKHVLGPENYFFELQANGMAEVDEVNKQLVELGRELHIGLVATNDCHYMRQQDARAHEILLCIQTGRTMKDSQRMRFQTDGFYFKSPEEMKQAFAEVPEAVLNTRAIAERCNVEFKLGQYKLPKFTPPEGLRPSAYVERLATEGLRVRFAGQEPPEQYHQRLKYELSVIRKMGYSSYFLIVWDFINYAKQHSIPVGPGRGSAAGSLVAWSLGITEIDPLKYGLLFERFLNPDRVSLPDIDVDFCKDKRPEVISYVADKYGKDHVAQIITFGTMAARASIRDVARALDFPYSEADRLAKLVPEGPKVKLKDALKREPKLKKAYDEDENVRELLDVAGRLEGLSRHASTHAAGVVISPEVLTETVPLYKNPGDETVTTQFDMGSVESVGLIKFDFLGLKTLTVIEKTIENIALGGRKFVLAEMPLDDIKTFELLSSGLTTGIFQLESAGMRDILVKMRPDRFEDLIALVALYRPGPIGSGMIDDFIDIKRGRAKAHYDLPVLKEILEETYSVILYQEQVMSIANKVAGFTMGEADVLRKAMGKKNTVAMEKQEEAFLKGARKNKIPEGTARKLFALMAKFAEYGFNKSHSAAYAFIAYQTAYLKAHYPVHFMAATLSADLDNSDKIVKSIRECRNMSVAILPPDINTCGNEFTVTDVGIRFGLGAVKGVGATAISSVLAARQEGPFESVEDFLRRVDSRTVNKKVVESLNNAGAFDSLEPGAPGGAPDIERLRQWRSKVAELVTGVGAASLNLFGAPDGEPEDDGAWDPVELLSKERHALGFYVSGSPLIRHKRVLGLMRVAEISDLEQAKEKQDVKAAGIVSAVRKIRTKRGDVMAYATLEDEGSVDLIVFPDLFREHAELVQKGVLLMVGGTLEKTERGLQIVVRELTGVEDIMRSNGDGLKAELSVQGDGGHDMQALKGILEGSPGQMPLYLRIKSEGVETLMLTALKIRPEEALIEELENFLGKGALKVV